MSPSLHARKEASKFTEGTLIRVPSYYMSIERERYLCPKSAYAEPDAISRAIPFTQNPLSSVTVE